MWITLTDADLMPLEERVATSLLDLLSEQEGAVASAIAKDDDNNPLHYVVVSWTEDDHIQCTVCRVPGVGTDEYKEYSSMDLVVVATWVNYEEEEA